MSECDISYFIMHLICCLSFWIKIVTVFLIIFNNSTTGQKYSVPASHNTILNSLIFVSLVKKTNINMNEINSYINEIHWENLIINIHPVMCMDHSVNKARVSMPGYKKYGNIQFPRSLYCTSIWILSASSLSWLLHLCRLPKN